jgi:hypothetical protein
MSLSLELLPADVLVHLFSSHMDELTVENCRAVSKLFKSFIDEKKPFPEGYLKVREERARNIDYYKKDPRLNELLSSLIEKKEEWLQVTSIVENPLPHIFSCFRSSLAKAQEEPAQPLDFDEKERRLKKVDGITRKLHRGCFSFIGPFVFKELDQKSDLLLTEVSYLYCEIRVRKREIFTECDKRCSAHYQRIKQFPKLLQPIIDIFGSMNAFEKLPLLDGGYETHDYLRIPYEKMTAPIMRGIDACGRIFFVLRLHSTENEIQKATQAFFPRYKNQAYWVSQGWGVYKALPVSAPLTAEDIAATKKFVETKQYNDWHIA